MLLASQASPDQREILVLLDSRVHPVFPVLLV